MSRERHLLKSVSPYYEDVRDGRKKFELRYNDRNFKVGDFVTHAHWDAAKNEFTGNPNVVTEIVYLIDSGQWLSPGYCCFGIELSHEEEPKP